MPEKREKCPKISHSIVLDIVPLNALGARPSQRLPRRKFTPKLEWKDGESVWNPRLCALPTQFSQRTIDTITQWLWAFESNPGHKMFYLVSYFPLVSLFRGIFKALMQRLRFHQKKLFVDGYIYVWWCSVILFSMLSSLECLNYDFRCRSLEISLVHLSSLKTQLLVKENKIFQLMPKSLHEW